MQGTLTIDEKIFTAITYADPGKIENSDMYTENYYRTFKVSNAVIGTCKSIALGGRNHWIYLDNLQFK